LVRVGCWYVWDVGTCGMLVCCSGPTDDSGPDVYSNRFGYGGIRWAQTAGYGYTPNPQMPNVFMATSVDTPDVPHANGPHAPGFNVHSPFKQPTAGELFLRFPSQMLHGCKACCWGDIWGDVHPFSVGKSPLLSFLEGCGIFHCLVKCAAKQDRICTNSSTTGKETSLR
jgi:hypothetical protein